MYTRSFPPHIPLPENYGGVALREIEEKDEKEAPPTERETPIEAKNEAPREEVPHAEETKKEKNALPDTGELLLLALAALLLQGGERQDNELLFTLLILLLLPT